MLRKELQQHQQFKKKIENQAKHTQTERERAREYLKEFDQIHQNGGEPRQSVIPLLHKKNVKQN